MISLWWIPLHTMNNCSMKITNRCLRLGINMIDIDEPWSILKKKCQKELTRHFKWLKLKIYLISLPWLCHSTRWHFKTISWDKIMAIGDQVQQKTRWRGFLFAHDTAKSKHLSCYPMMILNMTIFISKANIMWINKIKLNNSCIRWIKIDKTK